MFNSIIRLSIAYRYFVVSTFLLVASLGCIFLKDLIVDAVPDITNVQVQINTNAPGYSPFEVEQRITIPIELLISGIPGLDHTRSISRYGLSQLTAVFKDGTNIYFARQLVSQRLSESKGRLPDDVIPSLGPVATGLGEIFMFTIENTKGNTDPKTLQELREIQDWVVKPQLRTVPGVVDINSIGGAEKQIVVIPNLNKFGKVN